MTTIVNFKVEFLQYLDKEGNVLQSLPPFANDKKILLELYRGMVRTRLFDAKAVALQRTGKMGTFPSSLGQEAVSVGTGHSMLPEDIFCPYYRDQGAMFLRGVQMQEILAYWGGDERGSDFAGPKRDFPVAVPIASQCLHATGCAFALKYRQENAAVVTSIGDGGTSKGDFYEALNVAGAWNLPVVFIINNNQWAISVPLKAQTHTETLAQKAIAAGFEGIQVDGNDVIAVKDIVSKALVKAREGKGPTLIEAITYRLCDHTTADDAKRYVDSACLEAAWVGEPIKRLYNYLVAQNFWSQEQDEQLVQQLTEELNSAVEDYLNMPAQPATAIVDFHYEVWPESLQDQRDELERIENA
jgi:2-oxoisovalerate dehydrogenase E1 component alpha subunit